MSISLTDRVRLYEIKCFRAGRTATDCGPCRDEALCENPGRRSGFERLLVRFERMCTSGLRTAAAATPAPRPPNRYRLFSKTGHLVEKGSPATGLSRLAQRPSQAALGSRSRSEAMPCCIYRIQATRRRGLLNLRDGAFTPPPACGLAPQSALRSRARVALSSAEATIIVSPGSTDQEIS
jgi:hypothetical protein